MELQEHQFLYSSNTINRPMTALSCLKAGAVQGNSPMQVNARGKKQLFSIYQPPSTWLCSQLQRSFRSQLIQQPNTPHYAMYKKTQLFRFQVRRQPMRYRATLLCSRKWDREIQGKSGHGKHCNGHLAHAREYTHTKGGALWTNSHASAEREEFTNTYYTTTYIGTVFWHPLTKLQQQLHYWNWRGARDMPCLH